MIITENMNIDENLFIKTYSDAGYMIERDGIKYSEAIDPSEFNRIYMETTIPIEVCEEQFSDDELISMLEEVL